MPLDIRLVKDGGALRDFLAALVEGLQTATDALDDFETLYTKRAKINGQKMVLQAGLNDLFGVILAPFILVETVAGGATSVYIFEPAELVPLYVSEESEDDPLYMFENTESVIGADFLVKIPVGLYTAELDRQIKAEVNLFKLAGKTFVTTTY